MAPADLERLNYNHLFYFWTVARHGGISSAAKALRLSHPTLSVQVRALEEHLGEKLLARVGRGLALTEPGRVVFRYADEMFALGREMTRSLEGGATSGQRRLHAGIVDVVPKLVVRRLLHAALALPEPVRLICREDTHERLLGELATHSLDVVISDQPVASGGSVRAFNHLLGETSVSVFGTRSLARRHKKGFPQSLSGAPVLLPLEASTLRRAINAWLERNGLHPRVVAEFEDSALLKAFASDGVGLFFAPSVVAAAITRQHDVELVAELPELREKFYAITSERRLKHPAVVAITDAARSDLFSSRDPRP